MRVGFIVTRLFLGVIGLCLGPSLFFSHGLPSPGGGCRRDCRLVNRFGSIIGWRLVFISSWKIICSFISISPTTVLEIHTTTITILSYLSPS